jgi:serine/threonine protein kinase
MSTVDEQQEFRELEHLFDIVAEMPAVEREQTLDALGVTVELRRRLLLMIQAALQPEPEPSGHTGLHSFKDAGDLSVLGCTVGAFRLSELLGSGGTGSVYLAERVAAGEPRRVAIKLLAPHAAGPEFERRFEREQANQSQLDHPHIARLIQSGLSDDGQPYLAMEFVDGAPIDAFCDAEALSIRARLELLLQVCDALAYSHRNLLLHLDIKPTNLLVTRDSSVKLLDFGTSRLILPEALSTTLAFATPAYASPEQLRNEPLTTASDVYSVGALMYLLLSGRRPFESSSMVGTMERVYRRLEPAPLDADVTDDAAEVRGLGSATKLRSVLAGDLGIIAAKCMRVEPEARYASIDALAEDLRRYLQGREVLARPQTAIYRLSKFLRRNAVPVAATMAALVLLGVALGYAAQRRREATLEAVRARELSSFLYALLSTANPIYTGKPAATVPELVSRAAALVPTLIHDPQEQRVTQLALAESMIDSGDAANAASLLQTVRQEAQSEHATGSLVEADAFLSRLEDQRGDHPKALQLSSEAHTLRNDASVLTGQRIWADIAFAEVRENPGAQAPENLAALREAVALSTPSQATPHLRAEAQYALASDLEIRGQMAEAEALIRNDLAIYQQEPNSLCHRSQMEADLGYIAGARDDLAGSVALFQQAYDGSRACVGPDTRETLIIEDFLAGAELHSGDPAAAARLMNDALPRWKALHPGGTDLANALFYTASADLANGQIKQADAVGKELLPVIHAIAPPQSHMAGSCEQVVAETLMREGRWHDALPHAQLAATALSRTARSPAFQAQSQKMTHELAEIQTHLQHAQ